MVPVMSTPPQRDASDPAEIMVEVYRPEEIAASPTPGLEGKLLPRSYATALERKVLVVAEEILLRLVLAEALSFAGVGVVEAADAAEAADILAERGDVPASGLRQDRLRIRVRLEQAAETERLPGRRGERGESL